VIETDKWVYGNRLEGLRRILWKRAAKKVIVEIV
jgi:hypothetical protein